MAGKNRIEINRAKNKQLFLTIKSANNKKILHSETYKSRQGVETALKAAKKIIKNPKIVDNTRGKKK